MQKEWSKDIIRSLPENKEWISYYRAIGNPGIYHRPDYIKLLGDHYGAEPELFVYGDKNSFVYYPYLKRRLSRLSFVSRESVSSKIWQGTDIISSWYYGGPIVWSKYNSPELKKRLIKEFRQTFEDYCTRENIISEFIRYDPLLENSKQFEEVLDVQLDRETVYVDLSQSEQEIWERFEGRNRTSIRKAREQELEVENTSCKEAVERFTEIYIQQMKEKNASDHYLFDESFFLKMSKRLGDSFQLFLIKFSEKIIGGGIVLRDGGKSHDYLRATMPDYWNYQPNNYLLYKEILWTRKQGDRVFDLQGGRPGVFEFKKAFSPSRGQFFISTICHNSSIYLELVKLAREAGVDVNDGYFPDYRHRN